MVFAFIVKRAIRFGNSKRSELKKLRKENAFPI